MGKKKDYSYLKRCLFGLVDKFKQVAALVETLEQSNEALLGVGELRCVVETCCDRLAFNKIRYLLCFVHVLTV